MNVVIAEKLLNLRKQHGFSQEELAEKLGVSRQAVSKWERAEASPDTDNLIRLAKLYGISLDELLLAGGTEEPSSQEEAAREGNGHKGKDWFFSNMENKERRYEEHMEHKCGRKKSAMHQFPFPVLIAGIYILIGVIWGAWHPWWILFFTIPLYYGIADAIVLRREEAQAQREGRPLSGKIWMHKIPYPVLIAGVYLFLGFWCNLWHPTWALFLTIPIYYVLADWLGQRRE